METWYVLSNYGYRLLHSKQVSIIAIDDHLIERNVLEQ